MIVVHLYNPTNADKLAAALHRVKLANVCSIDLQSNIFCVKVPGAISDKDAFHKVLKRYRKHIAKIVVEEK